MDENNNNNLSDSDDEEQNITQVKKDKKKKKKNKSKNALEKIQPQKPQSAIAKLILEQRKIKEEEEARIKAIEEEKERKIKEEEEKIAEIKRKEEELKEQKRKVKQDKIEIQKKEGTYKTKSEKEKIKKNQLRLEQLKKSGIITDNCKIINQNNFVKNIIIDKIESDKIESDKIESDKIESDKIVNIEYKSPIFTILGHVDVGKTSLLDNLRQTSVQKKEAGGITQQLGSTLLSRETILKRTYEINKDNIKDYKIPGLLLVDTPGHEVFTNLRQKGAQLADIAIVIIDIVHGLEPQTIESIKILIKLKIPFVFALNKIDRLYGFNKNINFIPIQQILSKQDPNTQSEFETRFKQIQTQIMQQGLNCELMWKNTSPEDTINIIPISAISGHGIPDLLDNIIQYSQTILKEYLIWKPELECDIMEITNTEGFGFTADCVIKNGFLSKGDIIRVQTTFGQIITQIKNILTVPDNKDSKHTSQYIHHDTIKGSCGVKIYAHKLEKAITGTQILLGTKDELYQQNNQTSKIELENEEKNSSIKLDLKGIAIYTSSYGSIEALIQFIRSDTELSIPTQISQSNIGNVIKKDLIKLNLTNSENSILENMCVLAFEVKIDEDAEKYAKDNNITILKDETIYRLFSQYKIFSSKLYNERKEKARIETIFPCTLKIIESNIFNKKNPLVIGVEIQEGTLHIGTPLIILPSKTYIGKIIGIQINKQDVKIAKQGQNVCIKIDNEINENIMYGRQFTHKDILYSNLTRKSVDILKEYFKKDISKEDINLLVKLKKLINF
jgi:translation initiation factor 5B